MAGQWIKYIYNFDILVEEALRVCVKNSMQSMYEALHGDGTTEPTPILKLQANLKHNRVKGFDFFDLKHLYLLSFRSILNQH